MQVKSGTTKWTFVTILGGLPKNLWERVAHGVFGKVDFFWAYGVHTCVLLGHLKNFLYLYWCWVGNVESPYTSCHIIITIGRELFTKLGSV